MKTICNRQKSHLCYNMRGIQWNNPISFEKQKHSPIIFVIFTNKIFYEIPFLVQSAVLWLCIWHINNQSFNWDVCIKSCHFVHLVVFDITYSCSLTTHVLKVIISHGATFHLDHEIPSGIVNCTVFMLINSFRLVFILKSSYFSIYYDNNLLDIVKWVGTKNSPSHRLLDVRILVEKFAIVKSG